MKTAAIRSVLFILGFSCASGRVGFAGPPAAVDPNLSLAQEFEQQIRKSDAAGAESKIDTGAIIDTAEAGIAASNDIATGFKEGASNLNEAQVKSFIQQVKSGGAFTLLRVHQRSGKPVAVYRIDLPNGMVDYLEWYIDKDDKGNPCFVDEYDLARGELISQTIRRIYLAAVISQEKAGGKQAAVNAREQSLVDDLPKLGQVGQACSAGKYQEALDLYKTLSTSVQHEKSALIYRVTAANSFLDTNPAEYEAAIADFKKYFPNDPAVDLLGLDHLFRQKLYAEGHQSLDRLITFIGGDAHLSCMQGNLYLTAGQPADLVSAVAEYKKAVAEEPGNSEGYWGLTTAYLAQKDYEKTAAELTEIQEKLHIQMSNDLSQLPVYADFTKSKAYRKWKAEQKNTATSKATTR